jgi:hypothetical protein
MEGNDAKELRELVQVLLDRDAPVSRSANAERFAEREAKKKVLRTVEKVVRDQARADREIRRTWTTTKKKAHGPSNPNIWRGQGSTYIPDMVFKEATGCIVRDGKEGLTDSPQSAVPTGRNRFGYMGRAV